MFAQNHSPWFRLVHEDLDLSFIFLLVPAEKNGEERSLGREERDMRQQGLKRHLKPLLVAAGSGVERDKKEMMA